MDLCTKYGGFEVYHNIIWQLYKELYDNPEVSYHFIGVDLERLSKLQAQFVCRGLGGKVVYEGRPLYPVHKEMDISEYQMNEVLAAFEEIFLRNNFDPKDVKHICRVLKHYAPYVVSCKITLIDKIMILIYRAWDRFLLLWA